VENEFDVFETLHDRSVRWHLRVRGFQPALAKLERVSKQTTNECFAIDLATETIIGRVNVFYVRAAAA
jgi:hypothetical protein